jgi:hypothetical protein
VAAGGALGFAFKDGLPAFGRLRIERTCRWLRRRDGKLIKVQRGKLRGHKVGITSHVSEMSLGGNRELLCIFQS